MTAGKFGIWCPVEKTWLHGWLGGAYEYDTAAEAEAARVDFQLANPDCAYAVRYILADGTPYEHPGTIDLDGK